MGIELNDEGLRQAKELIRAHRYNWNSDWIPPMMDVQDQFIKSNREKGFSRWCLGIDRTKKHHCEKYLYLYGDFRKLYLSGLLDIEDKVLQERCRDYGSCAILAAIQELRDLMYGDLMTGAQKVYKQLKRTERDDQDDCDCCS